MPKSNLVTLFALMVWLNVAGSAEAQTAARSSSSDKRVESFPRLTEMRVKPPADAPSGPNVRRATQACPASLDDMCSKFWAFAGYFLSKNTIPARDRELVTLRTAWLSRGEYIWGSHHDSYATKAGITPEEVARVAKGPDAPGWSAFDAALLRAADELHTSRFISDGTWNALGERYTDRQRVEVVLTVAAYTSLAMYFNSTGGQMEKGHTGFPD
jgi:alkylhydroperoxidase family enzyme